MIFKWKNGNKFWYVNEKLHREDGPAIITSDGYQAWFINGNAISDAEIIEWIKEYNISQDWNTWGNQEKILFKLRFA